MKIYSQKPLKSATIGQVAQTLCLWKNCAWGVNTGECLHTFFPCPLRPNQRQSRADSYRRDVGRQIQTGPPPSARGKLERSRAGRKPETRRKTPTAPPFTPFSTSWK